LIETESLPPIVTLRCEQSDPRKCMSEAVAFEVRSAATLG
jgi:hypothetical protein